MKTLFCRWIMEILPGLMAATGLGSDGRAGKTGGNNGRACTSTEIFSA
ncbi:MAG: hypothetical protein GY862_04585 [Gammaproteobacteria bacterium]|nr:hypothetical protein [Gammaproteobacteria bacterium]